MASSPPISASSTQRYHASCPCVIGTPYRCLTSRIQAFSSLVVGLVAYWPHRSFSRRLLAFVGLRSVLSSCIHHAINICFCVGTFPAVTHISWKGVYNPCAVEFLQ